MPTGLNPFWRNEAQKVFEFVFPTMLNASTTALEGAFAELTIESGVAFGASFVNELALEFAYKSTLEFVAGITQTTKNFTNSKISEWIESGKPLEDLIQELSPMYGKVRAESIAVTEVTRVYAEANQHAWKESEIVHGKEWLTAEDDLVCPVCGPVSGEVVKLEETFSNGAFNPPAHTKCRCGTKPRL